MKSTTLASHAKWVFALVHKYEGCGDTFHRATLAIYVDETHATAICLSMREASEHIERTYEAAYRTVETDKRRKMISHAAGETARFIARYGTQPLSHGESYEVRPYQLVTSAEPSPVAIHNSPVSEDTD